MWISQVKHTYDAKNTVTEEHMHLSKSNVQIRTRVVESQTVYIYWPRLGFCGSNIAYVSLRQSQQYSKTGHQQQPGYTIQA